MKTFEELVKSRREWIDKILIPWCQVASRKDLLLAEHEWQDLAGRPDPEMTLWIWAWRRFPAICHDVQPTINETESVEVTCSDGRQVTGFPDARRSQSGLLFVVSEEGQTVGPVSIDDITSIEKSSE